MAKDREEQIADDFLRPMFFNEGTCNDTDCDNCNDTLDVMVLTLAEKLRMEWLD